MRIRRAAVAAAAIVAGAAMSPDPAGAASFGRYDAAVVGALAGGSPHVKVYNLSSGLVQTQFYAFDTTFSGGVNVAIGDVDGDRVGDIVAGAGPGGGPHVRVFSGATGGLIREFFAYPSNFHGGVYVAAGDVNRDGRAEIITGAGAGGTPNVKVFDLAGGGVVERASFYAYDPAFGGGVRVAAADIDGDGRADVVTGAGPGGSAHVRAIAIDASGAQRSLLSFVSEGPGYTGGVFVAATNGRFSSNDTSIAVAPGVATMSGSAYARRYDDRGVEVGQTFFANSATGFGATVALGNADDDSDSEIASGNAGGGSSVTVQEIGQLFGFHLATQAFPGFTGGVSVALGEI